MLANLSSDGTTIFLGLALTAASAVPLVAAQRVANRGDEEPGDEEPGDEEPGDEEPGDEEQ